MESHVKFFIVNAVDVKERQHLCDQLEGMDITINNLDYTGFWYVCNKRPFFRRSMPDCLVGYADSVSDFNGISVLGSEKAENRFIVIGGSTSAIRTFRAKTWVESLYEILYDQIGEVVIYDFAIPGDPVAIELLKLLRDGYHLKPTWVISMSGLNDLWHIEDADNQFNVHEVIRWLKILDSRRGINTGVKTNEDLFFYWIRMQRIIKAVTEIYGAEYLGILQPMDIGKNNKDLFKTMVFEYEDVNIESVCEHAEDDSFYLNLLRLLEEETENMYVDGAHYTEKAGRIIADNVASVLLRRIRRHKEHIFDGRGVTRYICSPTKD